jgi:hypothetical protein
VNPDGAADLLSQLRDIHGAPEAPFWPPAPGWWVLAALLLAAVAWAVAALLRRWRARRRRQELLRQLETLRDRHDPRQEPGAWLASVSRLLKVTALRAFPDASPGTLTGPAWAEFLGGESGPGDFRALASGPYENEPEFDAGAVEAAARAWLRRHG